MPTRSFFPRSASASARDKLSSKESTINTLQQALGTKEEELRRSATHHLELTNTVSSLRRDVHRLEMKCDRADESCSRAVEKAVDRVRKHYDSAETKRVKWPDGRIKDWVRDLVAELVAPDGVLAERQRATASLLALVTSP